MDIIKRIQDKNQDINDTITYIRNSIVKVTNKLKECEDEVEKINISNELDMLYKILYLLKLESVLCSKYSYAEEDVIKYLDEEDGWIKMMFKSKK